MYSEIVTYGKEMKSNGFIVTPLKIIQGLQNITDIFSLKRDLYINGLEVKPIPESVEECLHMLTNEGDLVFYTLCTIALANPVVADTVYQVLEVN